MRRLRVLLVGLMSCTPYVAAAPKEPSPDPPPSPSEIRGQYAATLEHIEQRLAEQAIWPVCENPPRGPNCGLIWKKLVATDVVERFVAKACPGESPANLSVACGALYVAAVKRKFLERYSRAVEEDVVRHCADVPADCATIAATEQEYLKSHNGVLLRLHDREVASAGRTFEDEMEAARAREEDRRFRQQTAATRAALMESSEQVAKGIEKGSKQVADSVEAAAARPRQMNCSSSWLGNVASTSCY